MAICDTCGNDYDKAFTVTRGDQSATFDSFEFAIHAMTSTCAHCGCRIIGHGTESGESCTAAPTVLAVPVTPERLIEARSRFPLHAAES